MDQNQQNKIKGVISKQGSIFQAKNFIITTGTFLRGMIHIGKTTYPAGRHIRNSSDVQPPSIGLADWFRDKKFPIGRATTGTPPRLRKSTINYNGLNSHGSDDPIKPFSFVHQWEQFKPSYQTIRCFITETNSQTHRIIQQNRSQLPTFIGNGGKGQGPRYCPAIQKKVVRFPHRNSHPVWLQPQGLQSDVVYPQGLNNGFPADIQQKLIRSIKGLQKVQIIRPGYAIQYDYVCPTHLKHTLQSSIVNNLYLAGQINGTTGYQQAAAQGIIAGINAGLSSLNKPQYILPRTKGYIGVLIDDLITMGISQPYRIFTSRSQYRLMLRAQNADQRLTPDAISLGQNFISQNQIKIFNQKMQIFNDTMKKLNSYKYSLNQWNKFLPNFKMKLAPQNKTAAQMISTYQSLNISDLYWIQPVPKKIHKNIETQLKYSIFTNKMKKQIQLKNNQFSDISQFPYQKFKNSFTQQQFQILTKKKPKTIHVASRLSGIRPTTITYLHFMSNKLKKNKLAQ